MAITASGIGVARNAQSRSAASDGSNQWMRELCANDTLARAFRTEMLSLITTLEANEVYTRLLQKRREVVAYLKSASNAETLTSNCTAYFDGYKNARKRDRMEEQKQEKYEANIGHLFKGILLPLVGPRLSSKADF